MASNDYVVIATFNQSFYVDYRTKFDEQGTNSAAWSEVWAIRNNARKVSYAMFGYLATEDSKKTDIADNRKDNRQFAGSMNKSTFPAGYSINRMDNGTLGIEQLREGKIIGINGIPDPEKINFRVLQAFEYFPPFRENSANPSGEYIPNPGWENHVYGFMAIMSAEDYDKFATQIAKYNGDFGQLYDVYAKQLTDWLPILPSGSPPVIDESLARALVYEHMTPATWRPPSIK